MFGPVLKEFHRYVMQFAGQPVYQILMIITDGQINDMPETKRQIVNLSKLGCSVIIIGVGNADFSGMNELDGDGSLLRDEGGNACERDVVQFVAFNEAIKMGNLAEIVLKEIPRQFCDHMAKIGFKPVPVQQVINDVN